jgi:acetylornithine deacetylase/succinyl-diaminopimelate desuccinylase-like protein
MSSVQTSPPVHGRRQRQQLHSLWQLVPSVIAAESGIADHRQRRGGGAETFLDRLRATDEAIAYARAARTRFVRELAEFIRFPSVSAQPRHAADLDRCASWLADHLRTIGLEHVRVVRTARHPIVTADWLHAPHDFALLIYGHYDVQPPDPLADWHSPPFEPRVSGADLYGRGASDDKGQMFVHLKALESWMRTTGSLPINVRCVFEGEEEIGSANLQDFLTEHFTAGEADAAIVSDMWMPAPGHPAITESLRGALSLELEVKGQKHDLHSGNFGGAIHNPLQALCEVIAKLHEPQGTVAIPRFYERVREPTHAQRTEMARQGPPDDQILRAAGAARGWGAPGFSLYERIAIRPSLSINGLVGGYTGPGAKAVIPARACAKVSFRLVPEQDPAEIDRLFRRFVKQITPPTVDLSIRTLFRAHPFVLRRDHPVVRAACDALRKGFGRSPSFVRVGGTIPVAHLLQEELGIPTVLIGLALPDDRMHGPNEKFHLPNFFQGIEASIHLLSELETIPSEPDLPRC